MEQILAVLAAVVGGATDISIREAVFTSNNLYKSYGIRDNASLLGRIIVAGGGGSAGYSVTSYNANGGAGGGINALDGSSTRVYHGYGGSQTSAGKSTTGDSSARTGYTATFGIGSAATTSTDVAGGGRRRLVWRLTRL